MLNSYALHYAKNNGILLPNEEMALYFSAAAVKLEGRFAMR